MNLAWSRKIDYYAGIPLCAAATAWRRLTEGRYQPRPADRERIVVMKFLGLGSIILAVPLLEHLRRVRPDAELFFLTLTEHRKLVEILGIPAERIVTVDRRDAPSFVVSTLGAIRTLRRIRPTIILDLEFFSRFGALLAYCSGAPRRVGFRYSDGRMLYRGDLYTDHVTFSPREHTATAFLRFAAFWHSPRTTGSPGCQAGEECDEPRSARARCHGQEAVVRGSVKESGTPSLPRLSKGDLEDLQRRLPSLVLPYIVFNIHAGELALVRRWPKEKFLALGRRLLETFPRRQLVCIGSASEREYTASFVRELGNDRVLDVSGRTTLNDLITLFSHGDVLITNDSGPMHLASLTSVPMVVLFGPSAPELFRPLSPFAAVIYRPGPRSPCLTVFNGNQSECLRFDGRCSCMDNISVEEVYRHVAAMIQ